jgi:hypothetical protein
VAYIDPSQQGPPGAPAMPGMPAPPPPPGMADPTQPMPGEMLPAVLPPPAPPMLSDVKIKRCIKSGELKVKNIPPEDFLIDPGATTLRNGNGRFFGDVSRMTRSDAKLKWPKKKDLIDELPAYTIAAGEVGREKQARDQRFWSFRETQTDPASEEIEIVECYIQIDFDGDGVAEWRQVCIGANHGENAILSNEEVGDHPYDSITPNPMPHRYRGRSLYDDVADIQRVKTVLERQLLDNVYLLNQQQMAVNAALIKNMDALTNPEIGGLVLVDGNPAEAILPLVIPFQADKILGALSYFDQIMEKRTGVSRSTLAMDTDALQYQTATAVNQTQSSAYSKVETYARNIAECGGLKELFGRLLKLFVENQKSVKHIKVHGEFVPMDPRGWNADMNVTINIGLGSGSRDRDLATLGGIAQKQELAIQGLQTPFNPICNVSHLFSTYRKMGETAGLKNAEQFFPEITQQQVMEMAQKQAEQQKQAPPPPEVMKIQADMQLGQQKLKSEMQMKQMEVAGKQQGDNNRAQLDQRQAEQKAQIEQIQAQADIAANDRKARAEAQLAQQRFDLESELKQREFALNLAMKRAELIATLSKPQGKDENGNPIGPDQGAISTALGQLDDVTPMPSKRDEAHQQAMMTMMQQNAQMMQQFAQAITQLAAHMSAPTEIVRDPRTGKVVGAQKRPMQ